MVFLERFENEGSELKAIALEDWIISEKDVIVEKSRADDARTVSRLRVSNCGNGSTIKVIRRIKTRRSSGVKREKRDRPDLETRRGGGIWLGGHVISSGGRAIF